MANFKDTWAIDSTFTGGFKDPNEILIVGVDIPEEDQFKGIFDTDRLPLSMANPIDPESMYATIEGGGSVPAVEVTKINGKVYVVEGRRRIIAARAVRKLQAQRGKQADEFFQIAFVPSKAIDLQMAVRAGNLGRFEDPPWVKARQAAKLKASGKPDKTIAALYGVEIHTLGSWSAYMNLDPEIQKRVEGTPQTLTWNAAIELGRMGEGEFAKQHLVLAVIANTGAVIRGERGRENFRRVCAAVKSGEITKAPPPAGEVPAPADDEDEETPVTVPDPAPSKATTPAGPKGPPLLTFDVNKPQPKHLAECGKGGCLGAKKCPAAAWNVAKANAGQAPAGGNTKTPPAAETPARKKGEKKDSAPVADLGLTTGKKLSIDALRQVFANIEPTAEEPLEGEGERAVFAALAVIVGQDPTGEGLKEWPYLYRHFKPALRSSLVTS